jgi:hypothetical protein
LSSRSGFFHAAGGVGWDQAIVHRLVQRGRENPLHQADGVGVQALFDLAGLEVGAEAPLVALEGTLADLVAGRVGEPTLEMLTERQPPQVGLVVCLQNKYAVC